MFHFFAKNIVFDVVKNLKSQYLRQLSEHGSMDYGAVHPCSVCTVYMRDMFSVTFSNTPEMCEGRVLFALLRGILAHRQTPFTPVKSQRSLPPATVVAGR